jgi:hypothetical protein
MLHLGCFCRAVEEQYMDDSSHPLHEQLLRVQASWAGMYLDEDHASLPSASREGYERQHVLQATVGIRQHGQHDHAFDARYALCL